MPVLFHRPLVFKVSALGGLALLASLALAAHAATAQSATGTVTGRVMWGSCVRGIPMPMTPDGQIQPGPPAPAEPPDTQPAIGQTTPGQPIPGRPYPVPVTVSGLPAGAVLVAVQNTSVSARTDEAGKFSLSGVPAGQYMTVAAGPVANAQSATAERPNVFVNGGQTTDIGTLALGGATAYAIACRLPMLDTPDAAPGGAPNIGAP